MTVSQQALVSKEPLRADGALPLLIRPAVEGVDLKAWAERHRDEIADDLLRYGGVLFRGFDVHGEEDFETFIRALAGDMLEYTYRSTPRTRVKGKVYTSTEYPADQTIPMHNEMAYSKSWPMKIWFLCLTAAAEGGETPIADSRRVYERIDPAIRQRFADKQVMYVRNYGSGIDLPWQDVFQTDQRDEVDSFCREAGIECIWHGEQRLTTRQVCQSVARHPKLSEMLWFNQAHLFHASSLPDAVRESLVTEFGEDALPRNACYGDGSPIEESALAEIREAYRQESVTFPWQAGDVLMLDNMMTAHGRRPFSGSRKVVVGMAEPMSAAGPGN